MRVLLLSMPDSFEHTPTIAVRMPNGALTSIAGNIDVHHEVAVADLVLAALRDLTSQIASAQQEAMGPLGGLLGS